MSMMGLYSIDPASTAYELCSPEFPKITIHLHTPYTGGRFVITTTPTPMFTPYIQGARLNGIVQKADWIKFSDITDGGKMSFTLCKNPDKNWGSAALEAPPSLTN